ncbi:MAG: LPS-assembly protein LptD [Shimia sp.]
MTIRAALLLILLALPAAAQDVATLVADRVTVSPEGVLTAEGAVEVFQGTTRVTAQRIVYRGREDDLTIDGPIRIEDGTETLILADQAALAPDLEAGILRGARLVLSRQLQVTAVEMQRIGGRYTQGYKIAATSCQVCEGRAPIWQIRAKRIVHDEVERQLYFDEAQFLVFGLPVFYLPRMRLPDPTLTRATGFLIPELRTSSRTGTGLRVPYFFRLGDRADLTVAPFYTHATRTVDFRYRQAFARGGIVAELSLTDDDLIPGETRGSLFTRGAFALDDGWRFAFDTEAVSDRGYLSDYRIRDKDRLDSEAALTRADRDAATRARYTFYETLRAGETNATIPSQVIDGEHRQRLYPERLGGEALLTLSGNSLLRTSNATIDSDADGRSDGLDLTRLSGSLDWGREVVSANGMVLGLRLRGAADYYNTRQDPRYDEHVLNLTPAAAVALRWPLARRTAGAAHLLEPQVQLAWVGETDAAVPNEDSTRVEFDEGNLFSFSRAPGYDAAERGARFDAGLTWTRIGAGGTTSSLTFGRVVRLNGGAPFSTSSGLSNDNSDWLVSATLDLPGALELMARATLQDDLNTTKNEVRLDYDRGRWDSNATYVFLAPDAAENRPNAISELTMATGYALTPTLTGLVDLRYDFETDRTAAAGLGLNYANECIELELSVSRRFTASGTLRPSTDLGLTVALRGFGTGAEAPPRRACSPRR